MSSQSKKPAPRGKVTKPIADGHTRSGVADQRASVNDGAPKTTKNHKNPDMRPASGSCGGGVAKRGD